MCCLLQSHSCLRGIWKGGISVVSEKKQCEGLCWNSSLVPFSVLLHMLAGETELISSLYWLQLVGHRAVQRWPEDCYNPTSAWGLQSSSNHSEALLEPASLPVWEQLWKQLQILLGGLCPCVKQHVILTAAFKPFDLWCFCCWLIAFCSLLCSCHPPLSLLSAATAEQGWPHGICFLSLFSPEEKTQNKTNYF